MAIISTYNMTPEGLQTEINRAAQILIDKLLKDGVIDKNQHAKGQGYMIFLFNNDSLVSRIKRFFSSPSNPDTKDFLWAVKVCEFEEPEKE